MHRSATRTAILSAAVATAVVLTACAGGQPATPDPTEAADPVTETDAPTPTEDLAADDRFPDIVAAELSADGDRWRLTATVSSPYDSPERYADAFRAVTPDGAVLGVRELLHDHAGEQPFTRSLDGLVIPADVSEVTVEGRDLDHGWGGATVTVPVPR